MFNLLMIIAVFGCFACLAGGVMMMLRGNVDSVAEGRLESLASGSGLGKLAKSQKSLVARDNNAITKLEIAFSKFFDVRRLLEQAGSKAAPDKVIMLSLALGGVTGGLWLVFGFMKILAVVLAGMFGSLPFVWIWFKKGKRLNKFAQQLPEALELISRALRAGHSLPSGFQLVGSQMSEPIGSEFARCFDEQNLGIPLEEAIQEMTERIPNVDLRFFAAAVTIQRQTGGDLAEILDKLGKLIRERFALLGTIQALTGEGRLSGVVLLALPPSILLVMLYINFDYAMTLFRDPMGQKLVAFAVFMQLLGAYFIRKIINIKV